MKEFIFAALPWIIMGICISIVCGTFRDKSKEELENSDTCKPAHNNGALGMVLGLPVGCILAILGIVNLATGISLGMLIGLAIGSSIKQKQS